jgi:hypothetical protein
MQDDPSVQFIKHSASDSGIRDSGTLRSRGNYRLSVKPRGAVMSDVRTISTVAVARALISCDRWVRKHGRNLVSGTMLSRHRMPFCAKGYILVTQRPACLDADRESANSGRISTRRDGRAVDGGGLEDHGLLDHRPVTTQLRNSSQTPRQTSLRFVWRSGRSSGLGDAFASLASNPLVEVAFYG